MLNAFSRMEMLIGAEAQQKLKNSKVAVFGIGGVGSFAVEALVRAGVGSLVLVDDDIICLTNLNRQLHALQGTIGKPKTVAMKERILSINPDTKVTCHQVFYSSQTSGELLKPDYDYVIDAIDTISAKIHLIVRCNELEIPIISCMGTGNKMDPTQFQVADIYNTSVDPLSRVMRRELRRRGINSLKVVYSTETPITPLVTDLDRDKKNDLSDTENNKRGRTIPGSVSFVPPVAGLILGGEVVRDIIGWNG